MSAPFAGLSLDVDMAAFEAEGLAAFFSSSFSYVADDSWCEGSLASARLSMSEGDDFACPTLALVTPTRATRSSSADTAPAQSRVSAGGLSPQEKNRARSSRRRKFDTLSWAGLDNDDDNEKMEDDSNDDHDAKEDIDDTDDADFTYEEPRRTTAKRLRKKTSQKKKKKKKRAAIIKAAPCVFRGVSCCSNDYKFQARIRDGSAVHYLGRHENQFDAALAYDEAARSLKGEAAVPNFQLEVLDNEATRATLRENFLKHHRITPEFFHLLHPTSIERQKVT